MRQAAYRQNSIYLVCMLIFLLYSLSSAFAEEHAFDISETEKKPYYFGGYLEFRPILFGLNKNASLCKLKFCNRDEGNAIEEYNGALQLEGSFEYGMAKLYARTNTAYQKSYLGETHETTLQEGYVSLKPSSSLKIDVGKKTLNWGKGYAWNPVAFLDRPKDPDDPELSREGYYMLLVDYIKSFQGHLQTFSFTSVLFPDYEHVNSTYGTINRMNFAGKFYFLLYDTDIDVIFFAGGSRTTRYGLDFSRNITTNLEIHGEFALINDYKKKFIDSNGNNFEKEYDAKSYLIGLRYLTKKETTYILEYYRSGTGFTSIEIKDYFGLINKAYDSYVSTGSDALLKKASMVTEGNYGKMNPMRDYLYFRVSQKEPFDILYFTPSLTTIVNLNDRSFSLSPEFLYTGITNLELRLKAAFISGERFSEYGEKQNDYRAEFRARYYF